MNTYAILRRNGWKSPSDLHDAAGRSKKVAETTTDIRWIRSYVFTELDGTLGTICIYEATGPDAIERHASKAELGLTEIRPIVDTVVVRQDPAK